MSTCYSSGVIPASRFLRRHPGPGPRRGRRRPRPASTTSPSSSSRRSRCRRPRPRDAHLRRSRAPRASSTWSRRRPPPRGARLLRAAPACSSPCSAPAWAGAPRGASSTPAATATPRLPLLALARPPSRGRAAGEFRLGAGTRTRRASAAAAPTGGSGWRASRRHKRAAARTRPWWPRRGSRGPETGVKPAELAATRREAGVDDSFWVPPPGWKPGDPVSPEARALEVQKQVEELAGELDVIKRQMKHLHSLASTRRLTCD
ncbi:hypothetical protein PVAP13_1NG238500 [Panicum virgatum]|uniref:Uncharacterized protein n=1 Tax=Panicum virgatum TaxID=38727 RepID=A0A8T0WU84_PANVG|nr:hypothetical protein PVAP13_1NG238500 [Panicum virgatum]KAG2650886.1 hypothetical protein PVAP13_1NG238500 [Panicum virgatum]